MRFFLLMMVAHGLSAATVYVRTTDGAVVQGETALKSVVVSGKEYKLEQVLSVHNAVEASGAESGRIEAGLAAIQGTNRGERDKAVEELTAIGVPVVTPLLKTLKDTDQHEPRPLYRLFERVMPSDADDFDRSLSVVRLKDGTAVRGKLGEGNVEIKKADGSKESLAWSKVRVLAVKQKTVTRRMEVHTLRHCQQIEYLDTGVVLTSGSKVESTAKGFARLSWNADNWACDPDGLKKPAGGTYTSNLFEGLPFGALIGRVGAGGKNFLVGTKAMKTGLGEGKLMLAVNDNRHWQNNLGTYRVVMTVTEAYDLGAAQ